MSTKAPNAATLVTNWSQYTSIFGDFMEGAYLAHAVYGYFLNGGGAAYVVRIGGEDGYPVTEGMDGHERSISEGNMKFVHVATRTKDLDAALAFYEALGLKMSRKTELTKGKATLAFIEPPEGYVIEGIPPSFAA